MDDLAADDEGGDDGDPARLRHRPGVRGTNVGQVHDAHEARHDVGQRGRARNIAPVKARWMSSLERSISPAVQRTVLGNEARELFSQSFVIERSRPFQPGQDFAYPVRIGRRERVHRPDLRVVRGEGVLVVG